MRIVGSFLTEYRIKRDIALMRLSLHTLDDKIFQLAKKVETIEVKP